MKVNRLFFLIIYLTLSSCLDSDFASNDLVVENDINYLHPSLEMSDFPNDHYRIISVTPVEDFFNVVVEYTGGCEEHRFYTWWNGEWKDSDPPEATFHLAHGSRGDECERVVRDTVLLDLDKVFTGTYPRYEKVKISVKNASRGRIVVVDPYLADIAQSSGCKLDASMSQMNCFEGIWSNSGFLLADSVPNHKKVWIQPVRSGVGVGLEEPVSGNYKIGVTLLFGFEYDGADYQCDDQMSDGTTVPAVINCAQQL